MSLSRYRNRRIDYLTCINEYSLRILVERLCLIEAAQSKEIYLVWRYTDFEQHHSHNLLQKTVFGLSPKTLLDGRRIEGAPPVTCVGSRLPHECFVLPTNTTSKIQPMDSGIIAALKNRIGVSKWKEQLILPMKI